MNVLRCDPNEAVGERERMAWEAFFSFLLLTFCGLLLFFYYISWVRPERIRRRLRRQGIGGPAPAFIHGNLKEVKKALAEEKERRAGEGNLRHDIASAIFPHFEKWRKEYGPIFLYTMGTVPMLHASHPDFVKEINLCTSLNLGKGTYLKKTHEPLFGQGILKSSGESWVYQRKIIAPEFYMDKVKDMIELMVDSANPMVRRWERMIDNGGGRQDINIDEDLKSYSADVISRTCFGSSYSKGKQIFLKLYQLKKAVSKPNLLVEATRIRHIPTRRNLEVWRLNKEVRSLILQVVKDGSVKEGRCSPDKNFLQALLRSANAAATGGVSGVDAEDLVVDNCKTIYFAGHETTALSATWCLLLLALHPLWQDRARTEVNELCSGEPPNNDTLPKMKTLMMVIQETLRLYPPGAVVSRKAVEDIELGGILLPKGINIFVPVLAMHQDPKIWGPDACDFRPERFENGIMGACQLPHMYLPFGAGSRTCLGQNFAVIELKIVLAVILQKFSFSLSPSYRHSPTLGLIVEPEFGVGLTMTKVQCN